MFTIMFLNIHYNNFLVHKANIFHIPKGYKVYRQKKTTNIYDPFGVEHKFATLWL